MSVLKRLEGWAKRLLAVFMTAALFRPSRRALSTSRLKAPRRILLVRPDNRVGEALLMTPLLSTLKALSSAPTVDILLHAKVRRVLEGHPDADRVLAFDRRRLFLGPLAPGIRALRREKYNLVVDCGNWEAPSVTCALIARLVAPHAAVIGPSRWPVGPLHDVQVAPLSDTNSEVRQRLHLLSPIEGVTPKSALSFRRSNPSPAITEFTRALGSGPWAVVNPGGRLGWRCVQPEVFAAGASELARLGIGCVITWGPGEEELARRVQALAPTAKLAPPTTLDELAQLMRGAALTLCNNTGPMHLSVAVGTCTVALFLHMDVQRWGHLHTGHRMLDLTPHAHSVDEMSAAVAAALGDQSRLIRPASAEVL